MIRKRKDKPVTVERITRAMVKLAWNIKDSPNGEKYLCIYRRLENELREYKAKEDAMSRVEGLAELYDPATGDVRISEPAQLTYSSTVAQ